MHTCMCVCMHTCMHACMYAHAYMHVCVHLYIHIYINIYIYIYHKYIPGCCGASGRASLRHATTMPPHRLVLLRARRCPQQSPPPPNRGRTTRQWISLGGNRSTRPTQMVVVWIDDNDMKILHPNHMEPTRAYYQTVGPTGDLSDYVPKLTIDISIG